MLWSKRKLEVRIRDVDMERDLNTILAIERQSFPPADRWDIKEYRSRYYYEDCFIRVAEFGNQVVGSVVYNLPDWGVLKLLRVAVLPSQRHQGVGTKLVQDVTSRLLDYLSGSMQVTVRKSNWAARRLFEHLRFDKAAATPPDSRSPVEETCCYMFFTPWRHLQPSNRVARYLPPRRKE